MYRIPGRGEIYVRKADIKAWYTTGMWLYVTMDDGTKYSTLQTQESYRRFVKEMETD
jgi:hypothetical protein